MHTKGLRRPRATGPVILAILSCVLIAKVQAAPIPLAAPTITTQPTSLKVTVGHVASFAVEATGETLLAYQWRRNGKVIRGATSSTYTTPVTTMRDNGAQFTVVISGGAIEPGEPSPPPATSNTAVLTVNPAVIVPSQPISRTVTARKMAIVTVPVAHQPQKSGAATSGATSSASTKAATTAKKTAQAAVVVSNNAGSATSRAAVLSVGTAIVAPLIATQPVNAVVFAGRSARFEVAATGQAPLSYQWKKNGTEISKATSTIYATPATAMSDTGAQYTVVVSNRAGSATSKTATLTIKSPVVAPSIAIQPANRSVTAGEPATFSVATIGTTPLKYQWWKDTPASRTAIAGAVSSSYTTPATTVSEKSTAYMVVVSNSAGSAASKPATLTVIAARPLLSSSSTKLAFGNVTISSESSQHVLLANVGTSNVIISNVAVGGAGFSASGGLSGIMLEPGKTATINVTFKPAAAGNATGEIKITSDAINSPQAITLAGTGVTAVTHSVFLSWNGSASSVAGYNVYSSLVSGGPYSRANSSAIPLTSYTDDNVKTGVTYYFVVTSIGSDGVESAHSSQVSVVVP
jgi:hypothetical protein